MECANNTDICLFIKVGQPEHIKELLTKGILYMNHINYFRNKELPEGVYDDSEGCREIDRDSHVFIQFNKDEPPIELPGVKQLSIHSSDTNQGNIYCLYSVKRSDLLQLDSRNFVDLSKLSLYGDSVDRLLIVDPVEFKSRVEKKLQELGYHI